jgi:hypothetical protein
MAKPKQMPPKELERAMSHLDVSFAGLGDSLGVASRTTRRWAEDPASPTARAVPPSAAALIRLMVAGIVTPRQAYQASRGIAIDGATAADHRKTKKKPG